MKLLSFVDRIRDRFGRRDDAPASPAVPLPFVAGDRVRDTWGNEAVVHEIDPQAEHGLGRIHLRYDDGREITYSVLAHDLQRIKEASRPRQDE